MASLYLVMVLLVFSKAVRQTDGAFNISCTTDYIASLNCTCTGLESTLPCEVKANCSDTMDTADEKDFTGRCVIRPPHQWCTLKLDDFFLIANPDTVCTLEAKQVNHQSNEEKYILDTVSLDEMIKPQQPDNLTLTKNHKEFNLSWDMAYKEMENMDLFNCLMYKVRLRPRGITNEKHFNEYYIEEDRRYLEIQCDMLSPGTVYEVDVQASVNPSIKNIRRENQWSDWSVSIECTCPQPHPEFHISWIFLILLPLAFGLFGFFGMRYKGLLKKPCLFQYIPDPHDFFKPLYHTYQGDFKKWVGPVFTLSSFEVLEKSAPLQVLCEKQQPVAPLQRPLFHDQGSGGSSLEDWSLLSLMNPELSKRYFLGGSSVGLAHSGGHISMDTVTVSGQEGAMSNFQDTNRNVIEVPDEPDGSEGSGEQVFDDWQLQANDAENGEELSLDSFNSNEHSDYGYPQIDLDTIDSGFMESDCSSPVTSECDGGERTDTSLLDGTLGTHSNYVKQWVAFTPDSGENNNSL